MFIEPKKYCEDLLKGKSLVEMGSKIRGLRMSMSRLKNMVEDPHFLEVSCPSKRKEICWYMDARMLFEQAGGVYKPSKAELRAAEFNERVDDIVELKFSSGSFVGHTIYNISFENEHVLRCKHKHYCGELPLPTVLEVGKAEWLERLKDIYVGEWRRRYYDNDVYDGEQWGLR